jgi:NADH-quinone oxidoreductase subunit A
MSLWPLGIYFVAVVAVVAVMLGLPRLLGERHLERATARPYESGAPPIGPARTRIALQYYVVAMLFVIFDLEAIFLFTWAVAARQLGWPGFFSAALFVLILFVALAYLWRVGALDWGSWSGRRLARQASAARAHGSNS